MRQWQTDFWSLCHMDIRMHLEQASKLGPDVTEMRAIKHTMELIADSLCIANSCLGKGGAGRLAWQNGPAQWAKYGNQV